MRQVRFTMSMYSYPRIILPDVRSTELHSVGPIIGGALSSVNFRWIFAINLPVRAHILRSPSPI